MPNFKLYLMGDLTPQTVGKLIQHRDGAATYLYPQEMDLTLCSPGGPGYLMLAATAAVKAWPGPTRCYTVGQCFSAAVPILAAAEHRVAHPWTQFMIHGAPETDKEGYELPEAVWRNNWQVTWLTARTTQGRDTWRYMLDKEDCFGVEEALEWGLIHEVDDWGKDGT